MQRSYSVKVGNIVRSQLLGLAGNWRDIQRCMTSDLWGTSQKGGRASKSDSSGDRSGEAGTAGQSSDRTESKSFTRASPTSMVTGDATFKSRGVNQGAVERRVNREDNMWHSRGYVDTQWLNPRDPAAYRPNFRQTEPTVMRKQFMRSPDEVSREVLGRDWEEAVKAYKRAAMSNMPDPANKTGWEPQQHNKLQLMDPSQLKKQPQQQQEQKHSQQAQQQQQQQHSQHHSQQASQNQQYQYRYQRQYHQQQEQLQQAQQPQQPQQQQQPQQPQQQQQQQQKQQPQWQQQRQQQQPHYQQHQHQQQQYQQQQYQQQQQQPLQRQQQQQQQHQQQQRQQQQHQQKPEKYYKHWNVNPLEDQD